MCRLMQWYIISSYSHPILVLLALALIIGIGEGTIRDPCEYVSNNRRK